MITIVARWTVALENMDRVTALLGELVDATRGEPGNLCYDLYFGAKDSGAVLIFEQYKDMDAIAAHRASPHFQNLAVAQIVPLLKTRDVQVLENVKV